MKQKKKKLSKEQIKEQERISARALFYDKKPQEGFNVYVETMAIKQKKSIEEICKLKIITDYAKDLGIEGYTGEGL